MKQTFKIRIMIQSLIMILFGVYLIFVLHHFIFGCIIGGSGLIVLISGLFIKPVARGLIWLQKKVMKGISFILTWMLLVPFFYLCFIPGRIILLITGKDPLMRKFPTKEKSYWIPYNESPDPGQYKRQY